MKIVCPHCTTFYAVDPASLGPTGRSVRCARCKEVWLAQPETQPAAEILAPAAVVRSGSNDIDDDVEWNDPSHAVAPPPDEAPVIDSPSIASEMPAEPEPVVAMNAEAQAPDSAAASRTQPGRLRVAPNRSAWLPKACLGMAAAALALIVWRAEIVRLLPQTARFYGLIGLDVNLRGLAFRNVSISTETVGDKPVLVIEGNIISINRKATELPRLHFAVRDNKGTGIYAWNAVLEQPALKPGETVPFRSRLASPPPEGRSIDVRFFNKRDLVGGG